MFFTGFCRECWLFSAILICRVFTKCSYREILNILDSYAPVIIEIIDNIYYNFYSCDSAEIEQFQIRDV